MTARLLRLTASSLVLLSGSLALSLALRPRLGPPAPEPEGTAEDQADGATARAKGAHDVMESAFCATCHPVIAAEHAQSTHGRAFTDEEVRLATGRFAHDDCIVCHTPRPIFETGVGQNPQRRYFGLEEGNTCMTCHWRADYDYTGFRGGAECRGAFHPDVGTVEACASCHRNHGTPFQWESNPNGKASGRVCIDCHMQEVERPIALGGPVREVHRHVFPGSRSDRQVRRAYAYEARIEGDHVIVAITNRGAGHNFPTELKQRSVESLVVVKDVDGREVARSRVVFRDPYKRPYGLALPVNTQIPGAQTRIHSVPLGVEAGTVECNLFFKLYYPIEDYHPDLARVLETRTLPFEGITPSSEDVVSEPEVHVIAPEGIQPELASPANLVDFAHPPIGTVEVEVPEGDSPADVQRLIELFQFPVPQANGMARARLAAIGAPAVPALIDALGSWDNKTYNQALEVLGKIGDPARSAVVAGCDDERLYVRLHSREMLVRQQWKGDDVAATLERALSAPNALDRSTAASAVGELHLSALGSALPPLLGDTDPDVVRAAAQSLALLGARDSAPAIREALDAAHYDETRCDLAQALGWLGDPYGVHVLLAGLDHPDDLVREAFFEAFFSVTLRHAGYDPLGPRPERLAAISALSAWWAESGGAPSLVPIDPNRDLGAERHAWGLIKELGGSDIGASTPDSDAAIEAELVGMGDLAVSELVRGLKYAPGFAVKRAALCRVLGQIRSPRSTPALVATLRDPVVSVTAWAAWALERAGDRDSIPPLQRYERRLTSLAAGAGIPREAGPLDRLIAQSARTRLLLGDDSARDVLVGLLLSEDATSRELAIGALQARFDEDRGYQPQAEIDERRAAAARWAQ